jgi:hypothetical protein
LAAPDRALPKQKRVPAGWSAVPIGNAGYELKLGLRCSAAELAGMEELTAEFRRIADVVVSLREPEGLWSCVRTDGEKAGGISK